MLSQSWFVGIIPAVMVFTTYARRTFAFFSLSQISIMTGVQSLWQTDIILACLVMFFSLFAPMFISGLLALMHFGVGTPSGFSILPLLGKLVMADVFIIALYIVIFKGVGLGDVETA